MKKIFIVFLSLIVFLGISLPVSKAESTTNLSYNLKEIQSLEINQDYTIEILKDTSEERVVEVTDKNGKKYKTTFNKKDATFETVEINKLSRETVIFNSNQLSSNEELQVSPSLFSNEVSASATHKLIDSGSNLSKKFKYYYYTNKIWVVQAEGKSKNPTETKNNRSDLLKFRDSVNNLRGAELKFRAALGTAATSTIIAAITAPTGWAPILATLTAIGAGATAIAQAYNSYKYAKDCRFYFSRITLK